jgi:hypothetical protein
MGVPKGLRNPTPTGPHTAVWMASLLLILLAAYIFSSSTFHIPGIFNFLGLQWNFTFTHTISWVTLLGAATGICMAWIAEVLNLKGLRGGMNRQDVSRGPEGWWPNWQIFYFCIRFISSTKKEVTQFKENFYAWETMLSTWKTMFLLQSPRFHKWNLDPPSFTNETQTSLFSPSFGWFHIHKIRAWLLRTCYLFLTFHKQIPSG